MVVVSGERRGRERLVAEKRKNGVCVRWRGGRRVAVLDGDWLIKLIGF